MAERRSPNSNPIQTGPSNSGNTNSNTSNTSTNNPLSPIPTPPPTSAASSPQTSQKSSKSSIIEKLTGSTRNKKKRFRSIRQNFNPISEVIDYQVIGDFDVNGSIPLYVDSKEPETPISIGLTNDINKAKYPQVKVNVVKYDLSKPNGTKRKVMDVSLAKKLGWKHKINLKKSILDTYLSYKKESNVR